MSILILDKIYFKFLKENQGCAFEDYFLIEYFVLLSVVIMNFKAVFHHNKREKNFFFHT